jgi:hypothetical protein
MSYVCTSYYGFCGFCKTARQAKVMTYFLVDNGHGDSIVLSRP